MAELSNSTKDELAHVLKDNESVMFVVNGKLISLESEDFDRRDSTQLDLARKIEAYPELKDSLQRYLDNPEMKRYSAQELKELRNARRK